MFTEHPNYLIHRIDRSDNPDVEIGNQDEDCAWRNLPFATNLGAAMMKTERLGMGMTIFHWKFEFFPEAVGKRIPFIEFNGVYPERSLTIRSVTGGSIGFKDSDLEYELTVGPDTDIYRFTSMAKAKIYLNGSSNCRLITLCVGETQLNSLLGKSASDQLLEQLHLDTPPHAFLNRTPHVTRALLHSTFAEKYLGQAKVFYVQAVVLEYLASLITGFATDSGIAFDNRLSATMVKIHEELSELKDQYPSLIELGEQYEIPPRTLNQQFIKQFNQSIYSFINQQRLDQAHHAIANSNQALKTIAADLSYSHVNHFSAAFKNHFGYSPNQLRIHKEIK